MTMNKYNLSIYSIEEQILFWYLLLRSGGNFGASWDWNVLGKSSRGGGSGYVWGRAGEDDKLIFTTPQTTTITTTTKPKPPSQPPPTTTTRKPQPPQTTTTV